MSTIDELQRLHEAATPGDWVVLPSSCAGGFSAIRDGQFLRDVAGPCHSVDSWDGGLYHENDRAAVVAARARKEAPAGSIAEVIAGNELDDALRALDDKEQRP